MVKISRGDLLYFLNQQQGQDMRPRNSKSRKRIVSEHVVRIDKTTDERRKYIMYTNACNILARGIRRYQAYKYVKKLKEFVHSNKEIEIMMKEDTLGVKMREIEMKIRKKEQYEILRRKKRLMKSNKRLYVKYTNAALKIQNYWKNNYIIRKRLHEILYKEEQRTYNNALQTKKVKHENIKYSKELKIHKKKKN